MSHQPLFPHVGICALVPEQWSDIWQPRHYVLTGLARYFHVVWMNPAPEWRGILQNGSVESESDAAAEFSPGFTVYEAPWLPRLYRPQWLRRRIIDARLNHARSLLIDRGCRKIILYIWRPEFGEALNSIPFDLSCYHIDDEYSFSENEVGITPEEKALITKVDQVFIHSPQLMEKKGSINPCSTFIPNGVDFEAYAHTAPEPTDLSAISRPRVGYTGYLKKQLDWPLILELSRRHRDWSFVFVGPRSPHPEIVTALEELASYPNVYFLGPKSARDLATYPQHFDACIMPYRVDAYTNSIYPLKLHEYLASGRPIVSTPIRSLLDFSSVIALANGSDEWSNALARALEPVATCSDAVAVRQNIARHNDWYILVHEIAAILCDRLAEKSVGGG